MVADEENSMKENLYKRKATGRMLGTTFIWELPKGRGALQVVSRSRARIWRSGAQ